MDAVTGIRRYDHVEFYVGSAKQWAYWLVNAFGMELTAHAGPETGVRDRVSYYLTSKDLKIVVTSALKPSCDEVAGFVQRHGDGVRRWAIEVDSVEQAFHQAVKNGAIPGTKPHRLEGEGGVVEEASIRLYETCEIALINRDSFKGVFKPGFKKPRFAFTAATRPTGLNRIDHIVGNVRENEMDRWAAYFNKVFGFETFIDFKAGDIGTQYSALLSKVVRDHDGRIKNPINEPYQGLKKSQIEEFLEEFRGSGVQHIAISTDNIIETVKAMRANGVEFLEVPKSYYEALAKRTDIALTEKIEDLAAQGILCDVEGKGYLLQLFTKPIGDRPTFFFEIIQRRQGAEGFGKGNFQSLFEAIEADQKLRGNLDR